MKKMEKIKIDIILEGFHSIIECKKEEKMKHILKRFANQVEKDIENLFFLYNGNIIDLNKKLEELLKREGNVDEIKILVNEFEKDENTNSYKKSQEIICPICKELCLIDFNGYKIYYLMSLMFSKK